MVSLPGYLHLTFDDLPFYISHVAFFQPQHEHANVCIRERKLFIFPASFSVFTFAPATARRSTSGRERGRCGPASDACARKHCHGDGHQRSATRTCSADDVILLASGAENGAPAAPREGHGKDPDGTRGDGWKVGKEGKVGGGRRRGGVGAAKPEQEVGARL